MEIYKRAIEQDKVIDDELIIAEFCFKWGCSRRTLKEYIKDVKGYLKSQEQIIKEAQTKKEE